MDPVEQGQLIAERREKHMHNVFKKLSLMLRLCSGLSTILH
jgi:hypothetical protein